jgi:dUTP pyrophosphatase
MDKYTLNLYPLSQDAMDQYVALLGGTTKEFSNENAGFDLITANDYERGSGTPKLCGMGVAAIMVNDFTNTAVNYWMAPRSSIWKNSVTLANSIGVIDRSYRGELMAALMPMQPGVIAKGTRLVQILAPTMGHISRVNICDKDTMPTSLRGEGGFGSTGV